MVMFHDAPKLGPFRHITAAAKMIRPFFPCLACMNCFAFGSTERGYRCFPDISRGRHADVAWHLINELYLYGSVVYGGAALDDGGLELASYESLIDRFIFSLPAVEAEPPKRSCAHVTSLNWFVCLTHQQLS